MKVTKDELWYNDFQNSEDMKNYIRSKILNQNENEQKN